MFTRDLWRNIRRIAIVQARQQSALEAILTAIDPHAASPSHWRDVDERELKAAKDALSGKVLL